MTDKDVDFVGWKYQVILGSSLDNLESEVNKIAAGKKQVVSTPIYDSSKKMYVVSLSYLIKNEVSILEQPVIPQPVTKEFNELNLLPEQPVTQEFMDAVEEEIERVNPNFKKE